MFEVEVNYWAVLAAGVAAMVLGYIWYLPSLAGGPWMRAIGKTEADLKADFKPSIMFVTFVLALITAYILDHFIVLLGASTVGEALQTALWAWLGFVATVTAMNLLYERRTFTLFWVNGLYQLANFLVMAVILFHWR